MTDYRRLMEEENPYLELMRQEESDALRSAMYGAAQTNPDVEADLRKLAEKVNVPVETVRIDRKEIERQAILGEVDYEGLVKDSPVTANFLAEQADVARDDVSVLTRIDRTFRAAGQGIEQASIMDQVEPLNWRWVSGEFLSPAEQTLRRELLNKMQALGKTPERGDNPIAWVFGQTGYTARQLVSSVREGGKGAIIGAAAGAGGALLLGQAGPQVALPEEILTVPGAFALGGSAGYKLGTLVYSYKSEAGFAFVEYEQMRDESGQLIDPAVARGAAAAAGLLNAGLETIGDIALAKRIPGIDRLLGAGSREAIKTLLARPTFRNAVAQAGKKWLQSASIEGVTESIQELIVILGRELAQGVSGQEFAPDAADSDLMRVLESGAAGFAGGAGVGLPGSTISAVSNVREVRKANQTQQFMQALGEAAGESKLRERLPQTFQDYVARIREQGPVENVFIPADQFTQYWQSQNVDPEQVANEVGATNYTEAVATGSDVVIPIEAYATRLAPTPHHSGLMKDVRLAQGDLTIREVEALEARRKEVEAEIQTMMEQEGVEAETPAIEQVKQEVLGQLLGRFDRATADNYATLYARAINSLAQRGGMDPMELHRQYGLEVVTPLPDILQARAGVDTALDPLIDRLRSNDIPSRREIYGKSLAEFLRERGGVQDQGGELGARDAKLWDRDNRRVGEKALVSETGMSFDEARELALEAGFDVGETEQTFLNAMDREFRGEGVFMPGKERADLAELADALEGLEQFLGQQGIDVTTTDNATVKALIAKASEGMGGVPEVEFNQPLSTRLRNFGVQIESLDDARRKWDAGFRIFAFHEQGDAPYEVPSIEQLGAWTADQLLALPPNAGRAGASGVKTIDTAPGRYASRTEMVKDSVREIAADRVRTPAEAAAAFATLARGTRERFDVLVTDKNGKPLAIVGTSIGDISSAAVYWGQIAAEAFRIQGAANIWVAHNHPSGNWRLSDADRQVEDSIYNIFVGTGIKPNGILAIGGGATIENRPWQHAQHGQIDQTGTTGAVGKLKKVTVIGRQFVEHGALGPSIVGPDAAKEAAARIAGRESGFILLDNTNKPIGFLPYDMSQLEKLRRPGGVDVLSRAISLANAAGVIGVHRGEMTQKGSNNVIKMLRQISAPAKDFINTETGVSSLEQNNMYPAVLGDFFYQSGKPGKEPDSKVKLPKKATQDTAIALRMGPPLTGKQRMKVNDVAAFFDRITGKRDYNDPKEQKRAVKQLVAELRYQMDQDKSGLDWYEQDIAKAFEITQRLIPSLASETKRQLFSVMAAILSPQTTANLNWKITAEAFQHYEKTGVIPGENPKTGGLWAGGTQSPNKKKQLDMLNAMVKDLGEEKAVEWLFSAHTVKELNDARRKWGNMGPGVDGKMTDEKIGLFMFGPKVGPFVANINGIPELTIDMWATRTFNRYFGRMLGPDGKIVDAPTEPERRIAKEIFNAAAKEVGIKPYQVQSVIWFFEQQLFNHLGTGAKSYGFSDGASDFARSGGVSETSGGAEGAARRFFQSVTAGPGFYSALARGVASLEDKPLPASGWQGALNSLVNKGRIKADEVEWSGIREWLDLQQGKVTRQAVIDYLAANGVRVEETVLGQVNYVEADFNAALEGTGYSVNLDRADDDDPEIVYIDPEGDAVSWEDLPENVQQIVNTYTGRVANLARYNRGRLVLPGGTNYREVLLRLPMETPAGGFGTINFPNEEAAARFVSAAIAAGFRSETVRIVEPSDPSFARVDVEFDNLADEDVSRFKSIAEDRFGGTIEFSRQPEARRPFTTEHWRDFSNVLAHFRVNDRVDADGKKVLFVEEIQSDWAQEGREEGFRGRGATPLNNAEQSRLSNLYIRSQSDGNPLSAEEAAELASLQARIDSLIGSVNAAPFVQKTDAWVALALKRIITMAASEGYDRVAFINGDQSVARYQLDKDVSVLSWEEQYRNFSALDMKGNCIVDQFTDAKNLPSIIGKELADRLLEEEPDETGRRTLSGVKIKIGGKGMRAFYDDIVTSTVKKMVPKLGGTLSTVLLPKTESTRLDRAEIVKQAMKYMRGYSDANDVIVNGELDDLVTEDEIDDWLMDYDAVNMPEMAREVARNFADTMVARAAGQKKMTQFGFDITPEMREAVVGGMPLFQGETDKRGYIQFGADRRVRIGLLEKADLSTFIHETGHFYLEVLLDLAERPDASPQIKADAETLMKWFGVKSRAEIGVKQHEEFARANEAYLMEGKAPSAELRTIFQRVRAWMTLVYRVLTNLNVRMNDDVRGVFDRIYATDKEIESANAELDVREVFATAQDAGMTEAEFAAYKKTAEAAGEAAKEKLQGRLIREYQREREKWWKAERAKMLEKVTEEVDSSPAYRAAAILTEGKLPDGVPVKLSRQALENRFGSEYLKRMPRFLRKVYTKDGGTDIDTAAEMLGFESGEALMTALINLRPRKELIEAETANRMAAEFGDMRMDGTIADEAMAAIHNSERANVLKAELVAIRRLQRQVRPVVAALRREEAEQRRAGMDMVDAAMADPQAFARAAAGRIGQMMARDISPGKYLLAERRASKAAFDAIRRKDYNAAATEKQRELLNHYMYLEARKAQQQLDRIYDYANKFDKKATRERLAKAGGGYLDQIDAILEKYEFRRVPLRVLARRQSLADFAEQQAALGLIVNVPDQLLDEARLVNYKNASVDELRAVYDTVRNIEHLARLKDKLLRKAAAVEFQETKDELIKSATESDRLATTGELRIPNTVGEPLRARGAKAWRRFDAAILKVEQMVEWLDNGKIDGPWARFVFDLANDAQVKEYELHAMVTQKIQDLTESMPKGWGDSLTDKVDVLLPGIESPVTRYTLISIAMNVGNDSNYQRLRDGYGWSDSSINAALGKLAKEDWDYIQGIWDAVNSLWPEIKALEERTSGVAPPKVEPRVVQTRFGDYRGGYFPLAYDPKLSAVGDKQAEATESVSQFMSNAYGRARTDRGYTKQRVENLKAAVRLDYEQVLTSHLTKVIKDISHREAIFSLNKILKDEEIKEVMIDRLGEARYREFTKWMQVLVSDRADTLHSGNVFSRAIMQFRTNMAIVTMGWKVTTMMAQFAGIGPALDTVKPRFFTQALIDYNRFGPWSTHRETLEQFVYDRSGEMKFRSDNIDRDVRDSLRTLRGEVGPLAAIRRSAFYLTAMADRQITIPTWIGAYRQALAEGLGEEDAIRAGDRAVRLSQGAAGAKDLAAVQRDNELMKLLTMYYTPFSVLYARMRDVGATTRRVRDMPRAVARMLALVILPAVLGEILAGRGPDEDEDETWWAIRKMLLYPLASVPILKEGSGVVEATMINLTGEGEMAFQPSWRLSPVAGSIEKVGRTFMRTSDVLAGDREFNDVAWDLFESSGYIFGLPTRQIRISGEYTLDVLNDERNPESPQQFMYEVLYGPPREQ